MQLLKAHLFSVWCHIWRKSCNLSVLSGHLQKKKKIGAPCVFWGISGNQVYFESRWNNRRQRQQNITFISGTLAVVQHNVSFDPFGLFKIDSQVLQDSYLVFNGFMVYVLHSLFPSTHFSHSVLEFWIISNIKDIFLCFPSTSPEEVQSKGQGRCSPHWSDFCLLLKGSSAV